MKFDPLGPSGLPSVKLNLLMDWLSTDGLVGEEGLRFY
jgi:hypothetical protein